MSSRNTRTVRFNPLIDPTQENRALAGIRARSTSSFDDRSGSLPRAYGGSGNITAVSGIDATYNGYAAGWSPGAGDIWTMTAPADNSAELISTWWVVASIGSDPLGERILIGRRATQATNALGWALVMDSGGAIKCYVGNGTNEVEITAGAITVPVDGSRFVATFGIEGVFFKAGRVQTYDPTNGYQTALLGLPTGTVVQGNSIDSGFGGNASLSGTEWDGDIYGGGWHSGSFVTYINATGVAVAYGIT